MGLLSVLATGKEILGPRAPQRGPGHISGDNIGCTHLGPQPSISFTLPADSLFFVFFLIQGGAAQNPLFSQGWKQDLTLGSNHS